MENHRHWTEEFAEALNGNDIPRLAELANSRCRFQRWYQGIGSKQYGKLEGFNAVGQHHVKMHELASHLLTLVKHGGIDSARLQLPGFFLASDALVEQIGTPRERGRAYPSRLQAVPRIQRLAYHAG
ncbi:MAG: CZB domain-containing protein [Thiohalocapsa sp. PB-PSB1]|nr:MAG: CZB domain-containing protein [Thiohalocapsa sp. PB-PSB1]